MKRYLIVLIALCCSHELMAQACCSGGGGNPIAGAAATGVLSKYQLEVSTSYQYTYSDAYFQNAKQLDTVSDKLTSSYMFLRTDYGLSDQLTLSVASGYYFDRSLAKESGDVEKSSGFGDLIIFPRYDVYNKSDDRGRTELTLGLGLKIPLGSHNDSLFSFHNPLLNTDMYIPKVATVQTTTGSQDLMFYSFIYRDFKLSKLKFFMSSIYIKKGYNASGQKFGDYASVGLFVSKSTFKRWAYTAQFKGEWIGQLQLADGIDVYASNAKPAATGSKKLFFVPQVSYSKNNFSYFLTSELPLYQNLTGVQMASNFQVTLGLSYRFLVKEEENGFLKTLD